MQKILIIEDNLTFAQTLSDCLPSKLYHIEISYDGIHGYNLARKFPFNLIILDNGLPKKLGIDIVKDLRRDGFETPILMISGDKSQNTLLRSLNVGADNYLFKPINLLEFTTRVKSILERPPKTYKKQIVFNEFKIDLNIKKLLFRDSQVHIEAKSFEILRILSENPYQSFSKQEIMDKVWGQLDNPSHGTVDVHISKLRKLLKQYNPTIKYIYTDVKKGYTFNPE